MLNTLFPPDTMFEVVPQFPPVTAREVVDFVIVLLIYVAATPVFIVQVKPPADFRLASKRREADLQLRQRVEDIAPDLKIPALHDVSAFGTRIAFYKYHLDSGRLELRNITPDPDVLTDTAPRGWWSYDILEQEGAQKFREVVDEVKTMCQQL